MTTHGVHVFCDCRAISLSLHTHGFPCYFAFAPYARLPVLFRFRSIRTGFGAISLSLHTHGVRCYFAFAPYARVSVLFRFRSIRTGFGAISLSLHTPWILKLNMTMWKYVSPVVRMFLSIHAKFVDNALYKARRALGE